MTLTHKLQAHQPNIHSVWFLKTCCDHIKNIYMILIYIHIYILHIYMLACMCAVHNYIVADRWATIRQSTNPLQANGTLLLLLFFFISFLHIRLFICWSCCWLLLLVSLPQLPLADKELQNERVWVCMSMCVYMRWVRCLFCRWSIDLIRSIRVIFQLDAVSCTMRTQNLPTLHLLLCVF